MKALINPSEESKYISSYNEYEPVYTILGQTVCEVTENQFEVASPLFWIDCNSDIQPYWYYYDITTKSILIKPDDAKAPPPDPKTANQPTTSGTQTI